MTDQIHAPWTPEQVAALNRFQAEGGMHPFTCGNDHATGALHLVAHEDGWHCWLPDCDYRQDWAHRFMADPNVWPKPFSDLRKAAATEATEPATITDPSWSARCRPPGCGAQPGEPCRRHDGSAASVSHGERWREYDRQQKARTQKHSEPATITDPEWLHQQYAAAVQPLLMDNLPKPIAAARAREIADTVLNVRDRHLAQLRQRLQLADVQPELDRLREQVKEAEAQRREWEDTAYRHAKHWRDEQEASHRLLTQRQDLAAERYVWQERGDQLAATLRQALDAFEAYWARASYDGPGETAVQPEHLRAWRAVLDGKE
jgi:hypothetical protein